MDHAAPESPRASATLALLFVTAAGAAVVSLAFPNGSRSSTVASEAAAAGASAVATVVMLSAARRGRAWPGTRQLALLVALIGIAAASFLAVELWRPSRYGSRATDVLFLLVLVPIVRAAAVQFRAWFARGARRELGVDVLLLAVSLTAIAYVWMRPIDATQTVRVSVLVFAIAAATAVTPFGVLALWIPSRGIILQFLVMLALAVAALAFGWHWTHGTYDGPLPLIHVPFTFGTLALAAVHTMMRPLPRGAVEPHPSRLARPVLTSLSVLGACAALAFVALFDDDRGFSRPESIVAIALLGLGIGARILANQLSSTQAHRDTERALAEKGTALAETDAALDRVREANETLRASEEHVRLVFEAAVDGIVELDRDDCVLRANDAFCRMVGLDAATIEGQTWAALGAAVPGADPSFVLLLSTGQTQIQRPEGQPMHLESRISEIPTNPPRRLLLVRDVTAARVADQTIRSLFQFLQDRDEDRTRLLRRMNLAIEAERNRVARDLHDGPVQGVSAASLSLEASLLMIKAGDVDRGLEVLAKIRKDLAEEADGLRRLMSGLRPPVLEERGLLPALKETLGRFGTEHDIETSFTGTIARPLPEDLETLAFRVVQEALSNAGKHADPTRVTVHIESDAVQMVVEIEDDGQGFDTGRVREFLRAGRVGLASMRERVELASGTFTIRSSPGRGTSISASLPFESVPVEAAAGSG